MDKRKECNLFWSGMLCLVLALCVLYTTNDIDTIYADSKNIFEKVQSKKSDVQDIISSAKNKIGDYKSSLGDSFTKYPNDHVCNSKVNNNKINSNPKYITINKKTYNTNKLTTTELHKNGLKFYKDGFNYISNGNHKIDIGYYDKNRIYCILSSDKDVKFYKNICVGMSQKNIEKKLGSPNDNDGEILSWYYNAKGKKVSAIDNANFVINCSIAKGKCEAIQLINSPENQKPKYSDCMIIGVGAQQGFFTKQIVKVYVDETYVCTLDKKVNKRCIMIPRTGNEHTIKFSKIGGTKKIKIKESSYEPLYYSTQGKILDGTDFGFNPDNSLEYIILNDDGGVVDLTKASTNDVMLAYVDLFY